MIRAPIDLNSPEAEAYRSLRTNLAFAHLPDEHRVLLFTSARRGEGKSTTAANFAVACAYSERPTLLVDADLRSPQIHRVFGLGTEVGLSTLLGADGRMALRDVARPTLIPYLDVIPAGPPVPNPSELLGRSSMLDLVNTAREYYDWIILDSPPVLSVTDAAILSGFVDGVVQVIDMRRTRLRHARRAREVLRGVRAPLLGVVVNQAKTAGAPGDVYGRYPK